MHECKSGTNLTIRKHLGKVFFNWYDIILLKECTLFCETDFCYSILAQLLKKTERKNY